MTVIQASHKNTYNYISRLLSFKETVYFSVARELVLTRLLDQDTWVLSPWLGSHLINTSNLSMHNIA